MTLHKISKVKGEYVRVPLTIDGVQVAFDRKQTVFLGQQKTEKKGKYVPENHVCPALVGTVEDQHNTIDQQLLSEWLHNKNAIALQTSYQQRVGHLHKVFAIPADAHDRLTVPDAVLDAREKRNNRHVSPIADVLVVTRRVNAWLSINGRSSWLLEKCNQRVSPQHYAICPETLPGRCRHELSKERCSICNPIEVVVPSKPRCNHVNSRSHTFTAGETIQFCPDCDYKNTERRTIFGTSPVESAIEIVRKEEQLRREWNARLATEDLPTEATLMGEEERLKHKANPHFVIERQAARQDGRVCQVNTSSIGLDSLGFGITKDRCSRDYRADERWNKEAHVLPTLGRCVLCGDEFFDRAGTLHCSDNHRKRYSELRAEFVRRNTLDIPQLPQWSLSNCVTTINTWFKHLWVEEIAAWL